jgi:hypothetical protein
MPYRASVLPVMSAAAWFIVILALVGANLPFINQRFLSGGPLARNSKNGWIRILELILLYLVVGTLGFALEARAGNRMEQGWQFYVVTIALFMVFAFPGFTYQYLVKRR